MEKRKPGRPPKTAKNDGASIADARTGVMELREDGWANVLAGIGGSRDKRTGSKPVAERMLSDQELETLYAGGGLPAQIVDMRADDMTRQWIDLEAAEDEGEVDEAALDEIRNELDRLEAETKFNEALKWARLFGGSVIIVGAIDGAKDLAEPLRLDRVREVTKLRVVDAAHVNLSSSLYNADPNSINYGDIEVVRVSLESPTGGFIEADIHRSRLLFFYGRKAPLGAKSSLTNTQKFFGLSEIQNASGELADFDGLSGSVINAMYEFTVGKFTLKNLVEQMAAGNEKAVVKRMNLIGTMKSSINAVLLGEGEEFKREAVALAGVPEILDRYMMKLAAVTNYPVTKLFGRSAAGMNATGENDLTNYYDSVQAAQRIVMKPALTRLIEIIRAAKKIKTPVEVKFNPLRQTTKKEDAEIESTEMTAQLSKAQRYQIYISEGVLTAEDVYNIEFADILGEYEMPEPEPEPEPVPAVPVPPVAEPVAEPEPVPPAGKKGKK